MNTDKINEVKEDKTEGGISDGASLEVVASELCKCANSWEPKARILGNVRAEDIVRLCKSFSLHAQRESGKSKPFREVEKVFRKLIVKEHGIPEDGEYDTNLGSIEVFCEKWVSDEEPEYYYEETTTPNDAVSREEELDKEELWDKYSERIDSDIDSLQHFSGKDVITKERFFKMIDSLSKK